MNVAGEFYIPIWEYKVRVEEQIMKRKVYPPELVTEFKKLPLTPKLDILHSKLLKPFDLSLPSDQNHPGFPYSRAVFPLFFSRQLS